MNPVERIFHIDNLLQNLTVVSMAKLRERLEVTKATVTRDITYMRDRLYAPIKYDRERRGYYLDKQDAQYGRYQLPGLWFNAQEIHAILTLERYFEDVSPVLGSQLKPVRDRLHSLLNGSNYNAASVADKIKIIHLARRLPRSSQFEKVTSALMESKRVKIRYYNRAEDSYLDREVSPLRLVHYRENWYLDGWCHLKKGMRIFSMDEIHEASLVEKRAKKIPAAAHDAHVTAGYGIFFGKATETAVLRFSAFRSRWVKKEEWHPLQKWGFDDEERYVLEVPYSDDRELIMDILKYGADVEVLAPEALKDRVKKQLERALGLYLPAV